MTRLGMSESAQYFNWNTTAHMLDEKVMRQAHVPGMWALCGQRLSYLREEAELLEERHKEHRVQKLCKRCIRKSEGTVRVAALGPLFGPHNLEIAFRGEWVHFGTIANMDSSDIDWVDAYRKLCQETLDRFLEGQKS